VKRARLVRPEIWVYKGFKEFKVCRGYKEFKER
jgi:hypothetical protein